MVVLGLFVLVLGARLIGHNVAITADEDNWMRRAGGFAFGLLNGQFGRTYQNGHPGVTTMWLTMLTLGPERIVQYADRVHNQRFVGRVAGFWEALVTARVGFAAATAALVVLISVSAWRLFGPPVGLLTGLIVGLEPFYLAISQLVHMDAVLAGCMVASVMAALVRWRSDGGRGWLAASGALAGLAFLSKSPAVFLIVFIPALAAWTRSSPVRTLMADLAVWLAVLAVTVVALWPAIWVLGPLEVIGRVAAFTRDTGGQPHEAGSFFWGEPRGDPGLLFYPVAVAFRLAPLTVLGAILLGVFWKRVPPDWRLTALALIGYAAGFLAMMTLGPKKFDRYLLPVFPALGVLAAVGIWMALERVRSAPRRTGAIVVLALLALWPMASSYPYFLAYYSPLLGGGPAAERTVMVGNGEGLDQVATWLNARPNAENLWVASHSYDILQPLIVGSGEPLRDRVPSNADYVVLYRFQTQIGQSPRVVNEYSQRGEPEMSVRIAGIEYARVYRGPHLAGRAMLHSP